MVRYRRRDTCGCNPQASDRGTSGCLQSSRSKTVARELVLCAADNLLMPTRLLLSRDQGADSSGSIIMSQGEHTRTARAVVPTPPRPTTAITYDGGIFDLRSRRSAIVDYSLMIVESYRKSATDLTCDVVSSQDSELRGCRFCGSCETCDRGQPPLLALGPIPAGEAD